MSKAQRRRNRKKARTAAQMAVVAVGPSKSPEATQGATQRLSRNAVRPTEERITKGRWAEPAGAAKSQQPIVALDSDMIGFLHCMKKITDSQEQAARTYQALREAFMQEMPELTGYKSCLAGGTSGYDGSDGNPAVYQDMIELERKIGTTGSNELYRVCVQSERPRNLNILRSALDVVAG